MKNMLVLPIPVKKALTKLAADIKVARIKRRITMELIAERAGISRLTYMRIEKANPAVSIGAIANVLFVLGIIDRLRDLIDQSTDQVGLSLENDKLPKRVRYKKTQF
jgi:transcriptional regulator with XRE-family HTH domain